MTHAAINVVVQMTIPAKYIRILKLQPNMCMKQDASMVLMICIIAIQGGSIQAGEVHIRNGCVFYSQLCSVYS